MNTTPLAAWIARALAARPVDSVWARAQTTVTWGELRKEVTRLEELFKVQGVRPGSTVAVQLMPSYTYLWVVLALWLRGAQVLLVDPRMTQYELGRVLKLCEPQLFIGSGEAGVVRVLFRPECEVSVEVRPSGRPAAGPHVLLQLSSGSTGHPKIIGRTAESLLAELDRFAGYPAMPRAGERVLLGNSLTHSFGLIGGVLHALGSGAVLVFATGAQPSALLEALATSRANVLFGVPMHFELLTRMSAQTDLPDLRLAVSGGEMLRPEIFEAFGRRFGLRIGQAYGMTEVGIIAVDLEGRSEPPAVGLPVPGLGVRVRQGELFVAAESSPYLYGSDIGSRYADGWLRTHDHCTVDPDSGVLSILGRSDSLVVIGGLKVDLGEVERALLEHPRVTEAVVLFSDTIEAFVGTGGGVSVRELQDWCRERLSAFKVPRRFQLSAAIPRTPNGKLIRNRELLVSGRAVHTGVAS